jgi:23S rRNA (cytidine1920-2'-O)/16S rRNA (cytidine1409-2'-O)-methyltransferase
LKPTGEFVALIKPQFEAGRENIGKNGVVKSEKVRKEIVTDIHNFSQNIGFKI